MSSIRNVNYAGNGLQGGSIQDPHLFLIRKNDLADRNTLLASWGSANGISDLALP
ncbi:hypothetical protein EAM_1074 [Erwinia amylovora ATCC 49946]|nr:hypothetical protein EAM_1074 [Erwinia amylovora ATCC 49946]